jgi:RNA polymerase sigma-70 factor (ECF subfamily)
VVLLRILGDLTVDQVAEVLGKSPGAVKQLQRRAFEALRRLIDREGVPL